MAQIVEFFNNFLGGAVIAFILSNIMNFAELALILSMMKDVKSMLNQFKAEGKNNKWLK